MRITSAKTFTVGNPWKNWVFVRLETDEGIYGVGEGTANAFAETIATAIHELQDTYIGLDPTQVELLAERMHRDVYTDGGQIHRAALAAIEIACWDILGKSVGLPVHALLGGKVRDRIRVYANGWYQVERTPEAFAAAARGVVQQGYTALKFDPFGHTSRMVGPDEESLAIDLIEAVRDAIGPRVDLLVEGHSRFDIPQAIRFARRMAPSNPLWFEEPVPHHDPDSVVEVALHSPVPIATGESFASAGSFAALLRRGGVRIWQPDPMHLGGIWPTRNVIAMARAADVAVAPHSAAGPDLLGGLHAAGGLQSEPVHPGAVRRVQPGLDARDRRSACRNRCGRFPHGVRAARDRNRPRLGAARRAPVTARQPHPPVRARMGATEERRRFVAYVDLSRGTTRTQVTATLERWGGTAPLLDCVMGEATSGPTWPSRRHRMCRHHIEPPRTP